MTRPGKMIRLVVETFFKKPATTLYPFKKVEMPANFRGKIIFKPHLCIGCQMCMKDCPSGAIKITKLPNKKFECEISLAKCIYCAQCVDSCPKKALESTKEFELAVLDRKNLKAVFSDDTKETSPE
ncbi:MAG: 4Fe-4S binding protein [Candidatus Omnitrophica bacterium]|nr:4Fe-4S binding protein [Candidatus Omnitrophota bacterium]